MVEPVNGLRPSRAGEYLTLVLPKPFSDTSSPLLAASAMAANTPSTSLRASRLAQAVICRNAVRKITIVHIHCPSLLMPIGRRGHRRHRKSISDLLDCLHTAWTVNAGTALASQGKFNVSLAEEGSALD
jgi:hypothetical protein